MLFEFQWHVEKHSLELHLRLALISISPESNVTEIYCQIFT